MTTYLLKLNSEKKSPYAQQLDTKLCLKLLKGLPLDELEDLTNFLMEQDHRRFQLLIHLIKKSYIYLECTSSDGKVFKISSSHLVLFASRKHLGYIPLINPEDGISVHSEGVLLSENNGSVIINPLAKAFITFDCHLDVFLKLIRSDKLIVDICLKSKLLTQCIPNQPDNSSVLDELFYLKTHDTSTNELDYLESVRSIARNQHHALISVKRYNINDYLDLDFSSAVLNRSTSYKPSSNLSAENIKRLIDNIFALKPNGKKLFPSAGAIYEIYPLIHFYDSSLGYEVGTYKYEGNSDKFIFKGHHYKEPYVEDDCRPRCGISLIYSPNVSRKKYKSLALKLNILNAGVILSYFYIFSSALGLNGSANGSTNTQDNALEPEHKDLVSFYLY